MLLVLPFFLLAMPGCGSDTPGPTPEAATSAPEAAATAGEEASSDASDDTASAAEEFPETLIEPFDPPPLAEIDATAEWIDQPVVDSLAKLRIWKAESDRPIASVDEALAMKNDSAEANAKILSALGQLAPSDGSGVNWEATISRALAQDLRSTNPLLGSSIAESEINGLTGYGLFSFDWNMTPHASSDSVVSWQTSKDRMLDKVVLRDDLTWSDGRPITAHDVVFSYQTIMNPRVPIPAQRSGTDELRWVEAYDDYTLIFFHKRPEATNVWNLNFSVIPKHIYEGSIAEDPTLRTSEYHAAQEENPVTGGAYEIVSRTRGQDIVLRSREAYYMHEGKQVRDRPYFKEIRFSIIEDLNTMLLALKSGTIDETEIGAEQWMTQTGGDDFYRFNTKVTGLEWTYFYFAWNQNTPYFQDKRVRQAMSLSFNHQEMIEDLCFGLYQPCTGNFHPESWMYPKNPAQPLDRFNHQDLDRAEALLDEAGWVDSDGDGIRDKEINGRLIPFEFTLIVSSKPDRIAICNLLRENLDSIGVICNVAPLEAAVLQERTFKKNYQASMSGWGAGADPYTNENLFGTGQDRNYGSYSSPEVDQLFKEGMKEFDREKRAAIYAKIHEILYEDQPYTFLYFRSSFYGFNKKLRGYNFSPRGPFHYGPGASAMWSP